MCGLGDIDRCGRRADGDLVALGTPAYISSGHEVQGGCVAASPWRTPWFAGALLIKSFLAAGPKTSHKGRQAGKPPLWGKSNFRASPKRMDKNNDEIPAEVWRALQRFRLELESELAELDGKFVERFAEASWPHNVEMLKTYGLERFDRIAEASLFCSVSTDPGQISPLYDQLLVAGIEKTVQFLQGSLVHTSGECREEVVSEMRLKLIGRRTRWIGFAKRKHLERHPAPILDLSGAAKKPKPFAIAPQIVRRRRAILADYRQKNDAMTTSDFARHVGISMTAVEGIVREDRKRYSLATRDRLLERLGISIEDWNRDR